MSWRAKPLNYLIKGDIMKVKVLAFAVAAFLLVSLPAQAAKVLTCCDNPACCDGGGCCK
jgi:hypothetical protein